MAEIKYSLIKIPRIGLSKYVVVIYETMKKIENGLDQGKKLIIRFEDNYLSLES
jgi:hypothetical protein